MTNKYLIKAAQFLANDARKDIAGTATIGTLGGIATMGANRILHGAEHGKFSAKGFAIGTGLGLAADYAGLKINKLINKKIDGK